MPILSAMQSAAVRLLGLKPTAFFSSSEKFPMEIADLANETAKAIAKYYDWQRLLRQHTINGNGTDTAFPLPDDYDRMPVKADVHSSSWERARFVPVKDLDQFEDFKTFLPTPFPGYWILLDGKMQILPAIPTGQTAKFYYITKYITPNDKTAFDNDADEFKLSERLLTLGIIWRWRAQKGFQYAEDMQSSEVALSEEVARDKGSRMLIVGNQRVRGDVRTAYPGALGT